MDDQEALLALDAGSDEERQTALSFLYDWYHDRLAALLGNRFHFDDEIAQIGAAQALLELYQGATALVPDLYDQPDQPWRWLIRRASDRATDAARQQRRLVANVPDALKEDFTRHGLNAAEPVLVSEHDPSAEALAQEQRTLVRTSVFTFLDTLEQPDKGILLHDLVAQYELLSPREAGEFDEELIGRSHNLWTDDALKKRRQRLKPRLAEFLQERLP